MNLILDENFKRSSDCDEFDKIILKRVNMIRNWEVTREESQNRAQEWNLLVGLQIFRVHIILNQNIIVLYGEV